MTHSIWHLHLSQHYISSKITSKLTADCLPWDIHVYSYILNMFLEVTVYFNFVGHRPATSIYLLDQSIFPTWSFVSWLGTCLWTTLLFYYLTVLSPTLLHECLSLVQCMTTLCLETIGYISSFFHLLSVLDNKLLLSNMACTRFRELRYYWIPLFLNACCIPIVSILLTSPLYQYCVAM